MVALASQPAIIHEMRGKESTTEYLAVLLESEKKLYHPKMDYLSLQDNLTDDPVSENWRRKLCEWCYDVVDHFSFDREVVSIAMDYLDRSVAVHSQAGFVIPKREYQLLAVTSLYMAVKIHGETDNIDGPRRKLKIEAFYELSRKQFDVQMIEETERHILSLLQWNVNPPTLLKFINTLLSLCPKWNCLDSQATHSNVLGGIYDFSRYLSELSVCQSNFAFNYKTSTIAFASVICSIEALHRSLPLPYHARVSLLNNIAEATGAVSGDAEVVQACEMLKKLCPHWCIEQQELIFDSQEVATSVDGKVSPVCVIEGAPTDNRKRKAATEWRPIHRPSMS
jgi:lipoyl(octanoyl) transferase